MGEISYLYLEDGDKLKMTLLPVGTIKRGSVDHAENFLTITGANLYNGDLIRIITLKNDNYLRLQFQQDGNNGWILYDGGLYDKYNLRLYGLSAPHFFKDYISLAIYSDEDNKKCWYAWIYNVQDRDVSRFGSYIMSGDTDEDGHPQIYTWMYGAYTDSTDPYDGKDEEENDGGDGTDNNDSDDITIPDLPDIGAVDAGFCTIYNPSIAELRALAGYMWSDLFSVDTFKKLFANPMDVVLGLTIMPCTIPDGGRREVKVGNVSTGVTMTLSAKQYISIDCGTLTIPEYWGAYLDYSPYTKLDLYLPMIGVKQMNPDEIIGKAVKIVYHIDILSGACVAYVKCGKSVLYEFAGQCATQIPITGSDWNTAISAAVSTAAVIGAAAVTGGAAALGESAGTVAANATVANSIITGSAAAAGAVMNAKPNVSRSGAMSGAAGLLGNRKPYFIMTRPRQCVPSDQNKFEGYPSYKTKRLGDCSGFTMIGSIHLEKISATDAEKVEIVQKLMEGVII